MTGLRQTALTPPDLGWLLYDYLRDHYGPTLRIERMVGEAWVPHDPSFVQLYLKGHEGDGIVLELSAALFAQEDGIYRVWDVARNGPAGVNSVTMRAGDRVEGRKEIKLTPSTHRETRCPLTASRVKDFNNQGNCARCGFPTSWHPQV